MSFLNLRTALMTTMLCAACAATQTSCAKTEAENYEQIYKNVTQPKTDNSVHMSKFEVQHGTDNTQNISNITIEDKLNAFKSYFGIKSGTIGVYSNNQSDYYEDKTEGLTFHLNDDFTGSWGNFTIKNNDDNNSITMTRVFPDNAKLSSSDVLKLNNDTVYMYQKGDLAGKLYKSDKNFVFDNGQSLSKVKIQNDDSFPISVDFDAVVEGDG